MRLFSNRPRKTSKWGKNISDTLVRLVCQFFCSYHIFDVICDLLLNRHTATWDLFVEQSKVKVYNIKRPSHDKLKLANLCWLVGKVKLVCVNGTNTVGKRVGKRLATNRTCLYSRQPFHQLFLVGKLVSDV